MEKKSILFFCPTFSAGGVEKVFVNLANYFAENNYSTSFLVCQHIGILDSQLNEKVEIFSLKKRLSKSLFQAIKFFKSNNFDFVVTGPQFVSILSVLVIKFLLRKKTKLIITHHSFYDLDVKTMPILHLSYKYLVVFFYRYADVVIAVSNAVKNHLIADVGIDEKMIKVIYNPVISLDFDSLKEEAFSHKWFSSETDLKIIVCVGRLSKIKNQEALIKLMPLVIKEVNCKLLLIGDGEEKQSLQKLIYELQLDSYIDILGAVENPIKYIKQANLLVLPSFSETFSLVAVESIAVGIPVLSTPTLGVLEILKDCKGCFFEEIEKRESFADNIITILNSNGEYVDSEYVKKFTINNIGKLYEDTILTSEPRYK
ncbi:glycosyltransferase [Flavobacterium aquidurense]|uniref:glycosyltransferase n=1 Tax=Flavobacterium aquidurense TaxID=362413 RepID=UPI00285F7215|nr:glycosyltransferase [Flavobacterium aquidurense]MDR7372351.1 glycosyltransferase involved in cell wall biosynthesis [Flavobacterium aquidurense]